MAGVPGRRVRGAMTARRSGRHQAVRSRGRGWAVLGVIVTGAVVATLAFATTTAAAKILLQGSLISPEQVQIAGLGAIRPRAQNDSPLGRTSNRRIEVRVVSLASQQLVYAEHDAAPSKPTKR